MCGICGIVNFDTGERVDPALIVGMNQTLAHRGPDDDGYFIESNVALGHRRLSIIDLEGGKQPIFNEDRSALIVFNGEVYNHADLRAELSAAGHQFKTRSDTEAILHAYDQYGDDCVSKLRGMFAFAIWDRRRRRLLLARDRLGIKPVYVYMGASFCAFASEIKALLELPGVPREVDGEALDLYLSLRYVPGPRTMFRNISKLQPGHILTLESGRARIRKYWDIEYHPDERHPVSYYCNRFRDLLEESVRLRLIADVPLGVFLSGGIDSSSILATMSKLKKGDGVKSFSVGYHVSSAQEEKANEFDYAVLAAEAFGAEHHEFRVSAEEFRDFVPRLVWHLDEPMADPSCIPLYFISRLARESITVALSGEGADEILAGYGIYRRMLILDSLYRKFGPLTARLEPRFGRLAGNEVVRSYIRMSGMPLELRYRGVSRALRPDLKNQLWMGNGARPGELLDSVFGGYFSAVQNAPLLDRMLYVDAKIWLPDDLLLKADKMTMANGLELRVPFLDHKLVEFAATLPARMKLNGRSGKFLLRKVMRDVLPGPIINRSKKGFPVPTAEWLRRPLRDFTRDTLLGSSSAARTYWQPKVLESMIEQNERGGVNRHQEIWTLLVFEFWHRLFIERRVARVAARKLPAAAAA